jgi:hypothetical protein
MAATATAKDFDQIFTPPPSLDWATLLIGGDLKKLEKGVELFESQAIEWRATSLAKMQSLKHGLKEQTDVATTTPSVSEILEPAIKAVEETIATFSGPMHRAVNDQPSCSPLDGAIGRADARSVRTNFPDETGRQLRRPY